MLSVQRLLLIFVFVFFMFYRFPSFRFAAAGLYLLAGATDVLDGWLARRCGWISDAGKILDPLSDKLFQITVLVCLAAKELLPVWLVIPFTLKELIQLLLGYLMIRRRGVFVSSSWYGKAATAALCVSGFLVLAVADKINSFKIYINSAYIVIMLFMTVVMALYIARYINVRSEADNILAPGAAKRK